MSIPVRFRNRVVEAEQDGDLWRVPSYSNLPLTDDDFREVFENVYDNVILTPRDLTEQLSQELERWGMTPLPLDAPVEATIGLTLAAVRQMTHDIKRITTLAKSFPETRDVAETLEILCT